MQAMNGTQALAGEVQMFRLRVATAECELKVLREQAREAKRRRKEARRIAQRARKQFKRSRTELAELRQALAKAEAKLFRMGKQVMARNAPKGRRIAESRARGPRSLKTTGGVSRARPPVAPGTPERKARKRTSPRRTTISPDPTPPTA